MRCIDRDSLLHETRELLDTTTPTRLHVELFCFRQMPHASSPKYLHAISPTGGLTLTFDFDHPCRRLNHDGSNEIVSIETPVWVAFIAIDSLHIFFIHIYIYIFIYI